MNEEPRNIGPDELAELIPGALERHGLAGRRVLCLIPDSTRSAPVPDVFRLCAETFQRRGGRVDFLIALGTHPPMSEAEITAHLGMDAATRARLFPGSAVYNHRWKDPRAIVEIGRINGDKMAELTGGLYQDEVRVEINRLALEYDGILIAGPVFPHEVVGFSGGNKYLFPGISGAEFLNAFHWLGALITNPKVIGNRDTPVKAVLNHAASLVPAPVHCLAMVMRGHDLVGFYAGEVDAAWKEAVALSARVNIVYRDRPFRTIFSHIPEMYHDIWLAGKGMYKLEPVAADGGEVIIYAPHISQVSETHGALLEEIGYHTRDYFLAQPEKFAAVPGGIKAHSTHVRGIGTFRDGVEKPRVTVTLATGIPESVCRRINLGYRDPASLDPRSFQGREAEGILYVPRAGEVLYRLADGSVPDIDNL